MNNRQIETSREIRLWVTGIIGPVIMGAATIIANDPELTGRIKNVVKEKYTNIRTKILGGKEAI